MFIPDSRVVQNQQFGHQTSKFPYLLLNDGPLSDNKNDYNIKILQSIFKMRQYLQLSFCLLKATLLHLFVIWMKNALSFFSF